MKKFIKYFIIILLVAGFLYGFRLYARYCSGFSINEMIRNEKSLIDIVEQCTTHAEKHYKMFGKTCEVGFILYLNESNRMVVGYQDVITEFTSTEKDVKNYLCTIEIDLDNATIEKLSVQLFENYRQPLSVDIKSFSADLQDIYELLESIEVYEYQVKNMAIYGDIVRVTYNNHDMVKINLKSRRIESVATGDVRLSNN